MWVCGCGGVGVCVCGCGCGCGCGGGGGVLPPQLSARVPGRVSSNVKVVL